MKTEQQFFEEMDEDFDNYPLPICFDPHEELKELNRRERKLRELAKEKFQNQNPL